MEHQGELGTLKAEFDTHIEVASAALNENDREHAREIRGHQRIVAGLEAQVSELDRDLDSMHHALDKALKEGWRGHDSPIPFVDLTDDFVVGTPRWAKGLQGAPVDTPSQQSASPIRHPYRSPQQILDRRRQRGGGQDVPTAESASFRNRGIKMEKAIVMSNSGVDLTFYQKDHGGAAASSERRPPSQPPPLESCKRWEA